MVRTASLQPAMLRIDFLLPECFLVKYILREMHFRFQHTLADSAGVKRKIVLCCTFPGDFCHHLLTGAAATYEGVHVTTGTNQCPSLCLTLSYKGASCFYPLLEHLQRSENVVPFQ